MRKSTLWSTQSVIDPTDDRRFHPIFLFPRFRAGLSVEELTQKAKEELDKQREKERQELEKTLPINQTQPPGTKTAGTSTAQSPEGQPAKKAASKERKDSSPVKVRTIS